MRVLVVGAGAREHALVWKLFSSPAVREVYCAPGNAGTAALSHSVNIRHDDVATLVQWAAQQQIDLTVVGPEGPLALGIVDQLALNGLACIGPTQAAARIETSKVWAKALMQRHGIPTARAEVAESPTAALELARQMGFPVVLKADGLAAGKGVVVARDEVEARATLTDFMVHRTLGEAAERVLVEEYLDGDEVSILAFTDGRDLVVMPAARDYKRVGDGDRGPNTGGMGAYAPVPYVDPALLDQVRDRILAPAIAALAAEGHPFKGVLYAGLMLTADGPRVLEFNCRFGDPEAQALLPLLDSDLVEIFQAIAHEELGQTRPRWLNLSTCVVVAASEGYPGRFRQGLPIRGLDSVESGVLIFQGGTRREPSGRHVVTAGGRVLSIVGRGRTLEQAREQAYRGVAEVGFDGMQYRRDIAAQTTPRVWRGRQPTAAPVVAAPAPAGEARAAAVESATGAPAVAADPTASLSAALAALSSAVGTAPAAAQIASARAGIVGAGAEDQPLLDLVAAAFARAGVGCDAACLSPYQAPDELRRWAQGAAERGLRVVVAIGATVPQLPALLAAMTPLPVIAVGAQPTTGSAGDALVALLALPDGIPLAVAGVGEPGARNAALLALAILALTDPSAAAGYAALRSSR
jgi:phosphoribosylamine--glycine ligase